MNVSAQIGHIGYNWTTLFEFRQMRVNFKRHRDARMAGSRLCRLLVVLSITC